jgi:hypothetical protein
MLVGGWSVVRKERFGRGIVVTEKVQQGPGPVRCDSGARVVMRRAGVRSGLVGRC